MRYPEVYERSRDTYMQGHFFGYNHRDKISEGEFYDMGNMSGESYPLMRPRRKRGVTGHKITTTVLGTFAAYAPYGEVYGVISGTNYTNTTINLYSAETHELMQSTTVTGHKGEIRKVVNIGADIMIFPDKIRLKFGENNDIVIEQLENETVTVSDKPEGWNGDVGYWYVDPAKVNDGDRDGIEIDETTWASSEVPEDPENGQWWLDNSHTMDDPYGRGVGLVRRYSAAQGTWVDVYPTYVKMRFPGIGKGFKAGDYVTISQESGTSGALKSLFGDRLIELCGDDYIVVSGSVANTEHSSTMLGFTGITVKRSVPDLDYITEAGNRLWGCRNEYRDGKIINEIYVSALGDSTNWNKYEGIASDSYTVTIGMGGAFTGACTYSDIPHFFKENAIIKVYGNAPSNFETVVQRCDGIEEGSDQSIANVDGRLFYKSRRGVMVYDGGYPSYLTDNFGEVRYTNGVGGELFGKYYISLLSGQKRSTFVYDAYRGLLHKEDGLKIGAFIRTSKKLLMLHSSTPTGGILVVNPTDEDVERDFEWYASTGIITFDDPDNKYVSRIRIRADIPIGAFVELTLSYNGTNKPDSVFRFNGTGVGSEMYMVSPSRCDTVKMTFRGKGDVKIYSIAYDYERGSDT